VSTILKALKRLDEERRAESAPKTLEEQVLTSAARREREPGRNKSLLVVGAVSGLLLLGGGAWLALGRDASSAASQSPQPKAPAVAGAAQPAPAQPAPHQPPIAVAEPAPAFQQLGPSADALVENPESAPIAAAATPARAQEPAPIAAEPRIESEATPEPPPQRIADALAGEPEPPHDAPAVTASEPEAPTSQRGAVASPPPLLIVERTQWHPAAEKRSAWVSASGATHEMHEGDAIEGAVVTEIRPSSVSFSFEGAELKRGVGEK
jgi:hypothetical protein